VESTGFSGTRAAEIVGITYRQLDYWARTNLVTPTLASAHGSGSRRQYSYRDLVELKVVKTLLDAGIRLEMVREAFIFLRTSLDLEVASAHLVISANQALLCDEGQLIDVLAGGQGVLNVLGLAGVRTQLDAAIESIGPIRRSSTLRTAVGQ
jgi:DNA-binding transcriptional MerR regulator